ncbi:hypothetical protein PG993_000253 [Apiospora rasikravindrae]|uniref:Uncharacterized protein n=1 Tax=Apiospora rasikravindrae TaxID=990691 RepID=A0ABR1UA45_9PEZI
MSELKNIWAELERGKADQNPNGKWGFTVYRTDYGDQKLWKDYVRHLRDTIAPKIDPDKDMGNDTKTELGKKEKAKRRLNRRIRATFQLVVVEDLVLKERTTAEVRWYHKEKIQAYLKDKPFHFSGFPGEDEERNGTGKGKDDRHAEHPGIKVEEDEGDEEPQEQTKQPLPTPPQSSPPNQEEGAEGAQITPTRQEKRVGHVWQDYFIHVDRDVLEKYKEARRREERLINNPVLYGYIDATPFVAIVAEAERSDYRLHRFGAWRGDGSVPEALMAWQPYTEIEVEDHGAWTGYFAILTAVFPLDKRYCLSEDQILF